MTIRIGGHKVDITVEDPFCKDTKEATMYFLNQMCAYCEEAARQYYSEGLDSLGDHARQHGIDIYQDLKKRGFYDKYREDEPDEREEAV